MVELPEYIRKVIRISAEDSPNVRLALEQKARGLKPTGEAILPGVIDWVTYLQRRRTLDKVMQCISLDGNFYEGAENLLYPPDWYNAAEEYAREINIQRETKGRSIGVDTAEGGDKTCWAVSGENGLIMLEAMKTPDTSIITGRTIALMQRFGVSPPMVMFDQGGGGQEHHDRLHAQGYKVRKVSFGESTTPDPVRYRKTFDTKLEDRKERYTFKNRRAQMYWMLHLRMDTVNACTIHEPVKNAEKRYAIPAEYGELRRQLAVMPKLYDEEGRIYLPPKRKKPGAHSTAMSIEEMLGCSPDEADAVVLSVYAMDPGSKRVTITPMV